ncbi:MAG TPA: transcriptional regulator [Cytophagales bacterium]|jgi:putative transcriptional regulator|nr:transcriptional regulator [Cytophagales bacterium]
MKLENILREVRQKKKMTQEELGDKVGVSRQTIISIETYRYKPTLELAMKLSMKLKCKIEKLFYFSK